MVFLLRRAERVEIPQAFCKQSEVRDEQLIVRLAHFAFLAYRSSQPPTEDQ